MTIRNMNHLFRPASVAVIGASRRPGTVGNVLVKNLLEGGFDGPLLPVNPNATSIRSLLAYESIDDLPFAPDLAVICTPPDTVAPIISSLGERGTRAAVVITAGFGELGEEGKRLESEFLNAAQPHLLRVVGPNCVGIIVPGMGLNASFAHRQALNGDIAFLSQSGAVITSVLDWAYPRGIGFSHLVSLGGMADVDFGDMLDYLARDHDTKAILLYIEEISHARKFMSAARAAARLKPVIVIKPGRHEEAAKAAASHTGALAGSDAVMDAAFKRAGILRVLTLEALFDAVETLSHGFRVEGNKLGILTNGGGVGVLATDRLLDAGGRLANLSRETIDDLNACLPKTWSHGNPVDIIGDAPGKRYADAYRVLIKDQEVDAVLALNCPTAIADGLDAAKALLSVRSENAANRNLSPLITCWLGEDAARPAREAFNANGIPTYETPGQAVDAFMNIVNFYENQNLLMQTPAPLEDVSESARAKARQVVDAALAEERPWLSEAEAKQVLSAYDIPTVRTVIVADADEAVAAADEISFPVALKILSKDITHKSDVGGVTLGIENAENLRRETQAMLERVKKHNPDASIEGFTVQEMAHRPHAVELIVGIASDPSFGPVILFGRGGTAVEVYKDKAIALPPLNRVLAGKLIESTQVYSLLKGYRDRPPADLDAIEMALLRLAELAVDIPELLELDINPLWADQDGVLALDARVKLNTDFDDGKRPGDRFAIEPYPRQLEKIIEDQIGNRYDLRPIRPSDTDYLENFIGACDRQDVRLRFFTPLLHLPVKLAARLTQIDYDREMAFVAFSKEPQGSQLVGFCHLLADPDKATAEYSVMVRSDVKGRGLGYRLMQELIRYAGDMGIDRITGEVLQENTAMLKMCRELGFEVRTNSEDAALCDVTLDVDKAVGTG